jgi:hypothetical protein
MVILLKDIFKFKGAVRMYLRTAKCFTLFIMSACLIGCIAPYMPASTERTAKLRLSATTSSLRLSVNHGFLVFEDPINCKEIRSLDDALLNAGKTVAIPGNQWVTIKDSVSFDNYAGVGADGFAFSFYSKANQTYLLKMNASGDMWDVRFNFYILREVTVAKGKVELVPVPFLKRKLNTFVDGCSDPEKLAAK